MIRQVFVDFDVILDLLLGRQLFFPATGRLFELFQRGEMEGHVSSLIFSNLFYILRRQTSGPEAIAALRKLRLLTRVLPVDEKVLDLALASSFKDFEDAIYAALEHGLDAIVTRNKRDYKLAKLPILDAAECVELYLAQRH